MRSRRRTAWHVSLSLLVAFAPGCRNGLATLASSGVPALTGASGAVLSGGPTTYTIDFGQVSVGDQRLATLSLSNTGSSPLRITTVGAPSDPEFSVDLASGTSVQPGGSVSVGCAFKPFSAGQKAGTIVLTTDSESVPTLTLDLQGEGVPVSLLVEPQTLDFGTVVIHSSFTKSITLSNHSALDLTISQSDLTGSNAKLFSTSGGAGSFKLAANGSVAIDFAYQPVIPSRLDVASVTFTPSIGPPIIADLQGVAAETGLLITPDPMDFNFVQPGDVATLTLHIRNIGNEDVNLSQVSLTDPGGGAFAIVPGTVTQALPLAPNKELDVPVQFTPTYIQPYQGEISMTSNDNLGQRVVTLQGFGGGAAISCIPSVLDFGLVATGIGPTLPLLCTNTGTNVPNHPEAALTIGRLPTNDAAFNAGVDFASSSVLTAGQTALIDVSYLPLSAGTNSTKLTVLSNVTRPPAPPVIQLTGEGLDVGPCYYGVTPSTLDWGAVPGADKSLRRTQAFTIDNFGPNVCVIDALRLSESDNGAFGLPQGTIASQLLAAPGQVQMVDGGILPSSITIPVSFEAARGQGSYAGQVIFTISDPAGPNQVVNLSATAVDSCFQLQPNRLELGAAGLTSTGQFCQKNRKQFIGINDCAGGVTITGISLGEGTPFEQIAFPTLPLLVPAGSSSPPFLFGFAPLATGDYYGEVKVQTDLLATPLGVTLHGEAIAGTQQTDVFQGSSSAAVDILWVVDTDDLGAELTCCGAPPNALDKLSQFVDQAQGIDYQMAVVTDDCPGLDNGSFEPCPTCFNVGSSPTYITPATNEPGKALTDLITGISKKVGTGTCNGNYNATMASAWTALQPNLLAGHNSGFLRDSAALAVVVYDPDGYAEDDGSPQKTDYYLDFFRSLKGGDSQLMSVSLMYLGVYGAFPWGPRYPALSSGSGGTLIDTSVDNWTTEVAKLWPNLAGGSGGFTLSGTPIAGTIEIWLDGPPPGPGVSVPGLQIPQQNSNGSWNWKYLADSNSLTFNGQTYTIGSTDTLTVVYTLACQ